jgi:hypothetical protein
LEAFIYFYKKFDQRKTHNMLALMLNMRYKNLKIVFIFVGKELGVVDVGIMTRKSSSLRFEDLLLLASLITFEFVTRRASDKDSNLDIF